MQIAKHHCTTERPCPVHIVISDDERARLGAPERVVLGEDVNGLYLRPVIIKDPPDLGRALSKSKQAGRWRIQIGAANQPMMRNVEPFRLADVDNLKLVTCDDFSAFRFNLPTFREKLKPRASYGRKDRKRKASINDMKAAMSEAERLAAEADATLFIDEEGRLRARVMQVV